MHRQRETERRGRCWKARAQEPVRADEIEAADGGG